MARPLKDEDSDELQLHNKLVPRSKHTVSVITAIPVDQVLSLYVVCTASAKFGLKFTT
jgi:hypothetical protein